MDTSQIRPSGDTASPSQQAFFDTLLSRQSYWPLAEPGPNDTELDLIFDAAMRAPDHGALRPWRFALIRDDARAEFGDVLVDVAARREPGKPRAEHEHRRQLAYTAPLVIVIAAAPSAHSHIPETEQLLSVGAAAMNMLNAIHALGYGGFWATGADAYDANLQAALDFEPSERVLGFLFVGKPKSREHSAVRPPHSRYVREWLGRMSV
ncbi:nitroreductase family protein [Paraburkholderia sp. 22099]|jgi:nitroreductase|uniref:Putative NAD(P)H nitroreductase n=1 Tax=Paraburkholderia terricola TaxID=169427 RepID=A0A1M6R5G8_9BURK|nr:MULTISPECIES: nitroreductase [Paraburkholderia]MDR6495344.1 nitroreductase [Paraburkholderia terricola]SDO45200.1 Nitroreductase [Paraburkholderia sediminicola]SHK27640.1 Nitroreductase [Paraburkholderia terricola]